MARTSFTIKHRKGAKRPVVKVTEQELNELDAEAQEAYSLYNEAKQALDAAETLYNRARRKHTSALRRFQEQK